MSVSDLATAALGGGVVGGFIAGFIARLTERDKGIRETMTQQADDVSKDANSLIVRIEGLNDDQWKSELPRLRQDFAALQAEVAQLHVLFHRQVYARADRVVGHIQEALDERATNDIQTVGEHGPTKAAADALAAWCECAGADIRRPSGLWRYDRFATRRFNKHERRVLALRERARNSRPTATTDRQPWATRTTITTPR